jgi:5-methylcytosine-specific restriction endonuclease McrA
MGDVKRNGGNWTEARFNSFVKSALRAASRRWPPKYECLSSAYVGTKLNDKSGRQAKHYKCACCLGSFPAKDVQVDHISPIINPEKGFTTWDDVVNAMFCEKENLQILCTSCHAIKTKEERSVRKKSTS